MKIKIIAAHGKNLELGGNNTLLWNLPCDLKHFKNMTEGKTVVMGQRTFESLPEKFRPLPGRKNVVLTLDKNFSVPGVSVFYSIPEMLENLKDEEEIWVMGGGMIYKQILPFADELHLTLVNGEFVADTFFPEYQSLGFRKVESSEETKTEKDSHPITFTIWKK